MEDRGTRRINQTKKNCSLALNKLTTYIHTHRETEHIEHTHSNTKSKKKFVHFCYMGVCVLEYTQKIHHIRDTE